MSEMGFYSLSTGKLLKTKKCRLKNFPTRYVGSFYRNLVDNVDNFIWSDFYGKTANDSNIPAEDMQTYILAASNFAKGIQSDINHYVTKDRINNASFRQKLDPISKNILRWQNPLELVFEDIFTFDSENPIVGALLRELDVGKKVLASDLIKQAPGPPGEDFAIRNRLNKLRDRQEPTNNNNNISPPTSPPALPPPPGPGPFILPPPPQPDNSFGNFHIPAQLSSANFGNRDQESTGNLFASQIQTDSC